MSRRSRENAIVEFVGSLAMLVALGWAFSPAFRQLVVEVAVVSGILLVTLAVLWALCRYPKHVRPVRYDFDGRPRQSNWRSGSTDEPPYVVEVSPPNGAETDAAASTTRSTKPNSTEELVSRLRTIDWFQFEKVVGVAYQKLGYAVTRRGGANPDGGIDLVVEKEGARTGVQCKHWKTWNVGVRAVREFLGALTDAGLPKGMFVTLNGYTGEAKQLADKHGIEIVNERGLADLLGSVDARYDPEMLEILRDTRKFCPRCESQMILRTATKGRGAGQQFWGCSAYPKCRFTLPKD